jgi:hypothetical protein
MREWMIILLVALAALALGALIARRRPPAGAAPASSASEKERAATRPPEPAVAGPAPNASGELAAMPVPNTKVLPHPEDMPVATLEFEGSLGHVTLHRGEVVIGRHSTDDVRIPDVRVSRHHARLVARSDGGFEIHNLTAVRSEPNPMLINGVDREHAKIADGDVITLGGVSFKFRQAAA